MTTKVKLVSRAPVKTIDATGINVIELREKKLLLEQTQKEINELESKIKHTNRFTFSDASKIIVTPKMMSSIIIQKDEDDYRGYTSKQIKKITAQLSDNDDVELIISMKEDE